MGIFPDRMIDRVAQQVRWFCVAAMVLAGAPSGFCHSAVLCIGADGHIALEFIDEGLHCTSDAPCRTPQTHRPACSSALSDSCHSCSDISLDFFKRGLRNAVGPKIPAVPASSSRLTDPFTWRHRVDPACSICCQKRDASRHMVFLGGVRLLI